MRSTRLPVMFVAAALFACEGAGVLRPDLPDGCASPRACQVTGIDLVVEPAQFLVAPDHARDTLTGRILFMPAEPVSYAVTVWNRGDTPSDSAIVGVYSAYGGGSAVVAVPPLGPGRLFVDTVEWQAPSNLRNSADTTWLHAYLNRLQESEDPLHANDWSESDTVIIALPVVRTTLLFPDTVQAEVPFTATVTVHNLSRFADMTPRAMAFCLLPHGCGSPAGGPFQLTAVPAIAARSSWTVELDVTIPDHGPYYSPWDWNLWACFADAGAGLDTFLDWNARHCVSEWRPITVLEPPPAGELGGTP